MNFSPVLFFRRIIALILLLAWVPASSHCLLASALQNAVVDCCVEAKQQGGESHHDSGCCPFCGTFESGKYLTSTKDKQAVGSEEMPAIIPPIWRLSLGSTDNTDFFFIPHTSPPKAAAWQFETRSARLGRSPNVSF